MLTSSITLAPQFASFAPVLRPAGAPPSAPLDEVVLGAQGEPRVETKPVVTGSAPPAAPLVSGASVAASVAGSLAPSPAALVAVGTPPPTVAETVLTDYHGTVVADPYRWLENSGDLTVNEWVTAQNDHTAKYLGGLPGRADVAARLQQVLSVGSFGAPVPVGDSLLYFRRDNLQNQSVLYRRGADGVEEPLLDPNTWSSDGTVALDWYHPGGDGRFIAYGRSAGGSEISTLHILDTRTKTELAEQIPNTRAASVAWLPDNSGFFYTRYPQPGTVPPGQENYHRHIYFHELNTDPSRDPKIMGDGFAPTDWPGVSLSNDGRHLLITVERGPDQTDAYVLDRQTNQLTTLAEGQKSQMYGTIYNGKAYMVTSDSAPRNRLVRIDLAHPEQREELVPQSEGTLETIAIVGGKLVTSTLVNATHHLTQYDLDGHKERDVLLPTLGTVDTISGDPERPEIYIRFSSFNYPTTVLQYDTATGASTTWRRLEVPGFDPEVYDVEQEWFTSADGTRVPMFVVHKKGIALDGSHPTYLTGYGGFNISETPVFSSTFVPWLEAGGIVAMPNLRGGGEFGAEWHEGGMLGNKQNVFDDFEGAAQHLIDRGYTSPEHLGISGGSNGGLLIGAAVTQRPDLFGAAVSKVPLLDMIRYDRFGIARLWRPEYGSADVPAAFEWLSAYSPYHNVEDGTAYPPTMFMSGAGDSRVDPLHARKMAARMQAASSSGNPILLREEARAGHGQGKPVAKVIEEKTDELTFVAQHTGLRFDHAEQPVA